MYPLYMDCWDLLSVFVEKETLQNSEKVENFVKSTWAQEPGYNDCFPFKTFKKAPAGCGPVAVGQVMRYFEHPKTFDWAAMPLNSPTYTTSEFLFTIAEKLNARYSDTETTTFFEDSNTLLRSYGYFTTQGTDVSTIENNCKSKIPVLTRGIRSGASSGHSWVISGIESKMYYNRYELWTFKERDKFTRYDDYLGEYTKINNYYMNWGWGGRQNGYYLTPLNYTDGRSYIYNILPIR